MKIRNSSRITAIVLALMMIVPLISVPAFAATKVDSTKATPVASDDFESYADGTAALGSALLGGPTNAIITEFDGDNAIKYDLEIDVERVDGDYWIKSNKTGNDTWYKANIDFDMTDINENDELIYSGTVQIDGNTLYFKDAVMNEENATTACSLYTDEACTSAYTAQTWHLCTAQVRNARQGHNSNGKALDSYLAAAAGLKGNYFVFSADYYFDTNIANKTFDFRARAAAGNVHVGYLKVTNDGITVTLHNDLKDGIIYNPGYTVAKGEWFNVTYILDGTSGSKTKITVYVNGNLAGYGEQSIALTGLHSEMPWNLGHPQRGGAVSSYYGNYYVDNCEVYNTKDVVPTDWEIYDPNKLVNETFNASTTLPSTVKYGGTIYEIATLNGSNALKLDFNAGSNASFANMDKPLTIQGCAVSDGILQIDVDYMFTEGSNYYFQGQFSSATGDRSTDLGADPHTTGASISWVDLYFIKVANGTATLMAGDQSTAGKKYTSYFNSTLPIGEQFTLSVVLDLTTGQLAYLVNGELAAKAQLYRTDGYLSNISIAAGKILMAKLNKLTTSKMSSYNGELWVDNINLKKIDEMPNLMPATNADFEDCVVGAFADVPSNRPTAGPSTATYEDFMGSNVVSISMLGATEATTLDYPFIATNARSYDIIEVVDSFDETQEITVELLNSLTFTGSINNAASDKPIYYAFDGTTVYVYNNNGNALATDGSNIGGFKLEKYVIGDANYNGMYRAMCGGKDSNIDKNFRVSHGALDVAGTYVLSADYFIANDASGSIQSQVYNNAQNKWMDLYQINMEQRTFSTLNGVTAGGERALPLLVDEWNTVTMIVTVAEDLSFTADIYLNGVYSHTKAHSYVFESTGWILAKIAKPSLTQVQKMAGYIYLDNVKVMYDEYDETKLQTIDASKVAGFDIDGKTGIINVSTSTELKLYATDVTVYDADFVANNMLSGIIATEAVASIRLGDPTGLRFATVIYEARIQQLIEMGMIKSYNHGTLIAPTDYLTEKELSFENFTEKVDMLNVKSTNGEYLDIDGDEFTTHFVGSIVNIKETNYDRDFTGRGYLQVTLCNGYVVTIYSATTKSISVADQAQLLIDSGVYAEDSAEYAVLAGFAAANN